MATSPTYRFLQQNKRALGLGIGFGLAIHQMMPATVALAAPTENSADTDAQLQTKLKRVFDKYASVNQSGELYMTPQDFLNSVAPKPDKNTPTFTASSSHSPIDNSQLEMLFRMADTKHQGKINFSEFFLLFKALSTPESEFRLAFNMFDLDRDGVITKDEFLRVMSLNKKDFDYNCNLVTRFFGKNGDGTLSYPQFSQFLRSLQEEIQKQEFKHYDPEGTGAISAEAFSKIITSYTENEKIPAYVKANISRLRENQTDKITYAEFDAFNRIIKNMDAIANVLTHAQNSTGEAISPEQFSRAAKLTSGIILSPMEVKLIFQIFDSDGDGLLHASDYEQLLKVVQAKRDSNRLWEAWIYEAAPANAQAAGSAVAAEGSKSFWKKTTETMIRGAGNFTIGGIAGAIGATAVYPIDLVKTRMQNQRFKAGEARKYANSMDCFKQTLRNEGFRGLYRGLGPQLIGVAPEKALKLVVNDALRALFENKQSGDVSFPLEVLAGSGAGASQVIVTNPLEIVKIRLQVQGEIARETGAAPKGAAVIIRELGFKGLYRGASACFLRDIPFSGIYFPTYAGFKRVFTQEGETQPGPWGLLFAGSIAGAVAASSTTPADVIKTRLQVEARKGEVAYTGLWDCARKVYQAEGIAAFFKGVVPRVFRSSPQFGVTLLAYELLQRAVYGDQPAKTSSHTLVGNVPLQQAEYDAFRALLDARLAALRNIVGGKIVTPTHAPSGSEPKKHE